MAAHRFRFAALGAGFALGFVACFQEPAPPPAFRFNCSADSDCTGVLEICADGLCQQPCGGEMDHACQSGNCFNGYCSGLCSLKDDECSDPQVCTALELPSDDPYDKPLDTGVCVIPCGDDRPCPEGQLCFDELGLCVATCMTSVDCGQGEQCFGGICIPTG